MDDVADSGNTVMTAVTEALKTDKLDKGLYPEDLYLVNYLTRAVNVFSRKDLADFSRVLWGVEIRGVKRPDGAAFKIDFTYSIDWALLKEDLSSIITQTDTFYIRCLGCEIIRRKGIVDVRVDGDDMEEGKQYNITYEAPETFKCMWRK